MSSRATPCDPKSVMSPSEFLPGVAPPTTSARPGLSCTRGGRLAITRRNYRKDRFPPDTNCRCPTCSHYSRAYLHHLFQSDEILGQMLATTHNVYFYQELMANIRDAIQHDRFAAFKKDFLSSYFREEKKTGHVR